MATQSASEHMHHPNLQFLFCHIIHFILFCHNFQIIKAIEKIFKDNKDSILTHEKLIQLFPKAPTAANVKKIIAQKDKPATTRKVKKVEPEGAKPAAQQPQKKLDKQTLGNKTQKDLERYLRNDPNAQERRGRGGRRVVYG